MSRHAGIARKARDFQFPYIEKLFRELGDDGRLSLDETQFCTLLNELNLQIPLPIMHDIFHQIKTLPSMRISLHDFEAFLLDEPAKIRLKERYSILITELKSVTNEAFGFVMANDSEISRRNTIICELTDPRARRCILPGSEILEVGGTNVEGRKSHEITELLEGKMRKIKQQNEKEEVKKPLEVKMVLRRKLTPHNLAMLAGNSTWRILGKEIGRKRRRKRIDLIKFGPELPDDDPLKQFPNCPREPGWKQHIYRSFEDEDYNVISGWILAMVMFCIIISTFAFVLETLPSLEGHWMFNVVEYFVSLFFTIEYGAKILTCRNMWKFFWNPMNMIDFLAIIPFWISLTFSSKDSATLRVIRVVRLTRLLRLLKSPQFKEYMTLVSRALYRSTQAFFLTFTLIGLYVIIFGSVIYMFEKGDLNEDGIYVRTDGAESPYDSILKAIYWCVVSMTSVGYGDFYPITVEGQTISVVTLLTGVLVIALPVIIIGGELTEVLAEHEKQKVEVDDVMGSDIFKYFQDINRIINEVCEAGGTENYIEYFTMKDVNDFIDADIDSKAKLLGLFRNGIHNLRFCPSKVEKKKIMYLYYLFGKRESQTSEFEGANRIRKLFRDKLMFPPKEESKRTAGPPLKSKRQKIKILQFHGILSNSSAAMSAGVAGSPIATNEKNGAHTVEMMPLKQEREIPVE